MPRRSLDYSKLMGLEDERKLALLDAISTVKNNSSWDSTSEIPGTGPEKEIYNYLMKIGIRFQFQYHMLDLPSTAFPEDVWIPDFQLPDYNILIEVYGYYWHSVPNRREGDQLKKTYWLNSGYTVYELGIPLYPDGGMSSGKAVIWWDWEIYQDLDSLFNRDLPELLSPDRVTGLPEEYILDAEQEKLKLRAQKAAGIGSRMRPKKPVFELQMRKLRRELFDINKMNPILKQLEEYAIPKISQKL